MHKTKTSVESYKKTTSLTTKDTDKYTRHPVFLATQNSTKPQQMKLNHCQIKYTSLSSTADGLKLDNLSQAGTWLASQLLGEHTPSPGSHTQLDNPLKPQHTHSNNKGQTQKKNNHHTHNPRPKTKNPSSKSLLFKSPPSSFPTTTLYQTHPPHLKPNSTKQDNHFDIMPTSSGANKRARAEDNESNVAKKKAVFDPKEAADTPKVGGKKMTAAQKRKLEAEAKAKAAEEALPDIEEENPQAQADAGTPPGPSGYQYQGHSAYPGPNPGPFVTPGKPAEAPGPSTSPQPGPSGMQGFTSNGQTYRPGYVNIPPQHQQHVMPQPPRQMGQQVSQPPPHAQQHPQVVAQQQQLHPQPGQQPLPQGQQAQGQQPQDLHSQVHQPHVPHQTQQPQTYSHHPQAPIPRYAQSSYADQQVYFTTYPGQPMPPVPPPQQSTSTDLGFIMALAEDPFKALTMATTPAEVKHCLLYTSPSPRDRQKSRMPSSA